MSSYVTGLLVLFVAVLVVDVQLFAISRWDYVKDGRPVDGPFPSNLGRIPYFCYQAPSKGACHMMQFRWFFDIVRRECMPMFYSGCGGNENRFESKSECNLYCGTRKANTIM